MELKCYHSKLKRESFITCLCLLQFFQSGFNLGHLGFNILNFLKIERNLGELLTNETDLAMFQREIYFLELTLLLILDFAKYYRVLVFEKENKMFWAHIYIFLYNLLFFFSPPTLLVYICLHQLLRILEDLLFPLLAHILQIVYQLLLGLNFLSVRLLSFLFNHIRLASLSFKVNKNEMRREE